MVTKMFLSAVVVVLSFSVISAQVLDQGNFVIGSTIGISANDSKVSVRTNAVDQEGEGPSAFQLNFAPKVGYFLIDHLALGMGLDYTFSRVENPSQDKTDDSDLLFGPFVRYYVLVGDDMAFFVETDFGFGNSSDQQYIGEARQSINTHVFALGFGPGFTIFSTQDIGIEALLKYNYARSQFETENGGITTTTTTRTNQFDIAVGIQFYFGGVRKVGN